MVAHVMLIEGVLTHRVEQSDFLVLLSCKASYRVISKSVIVFHFGNDFLGQEFIIVCNIFDLRLIVEPVWFLGVKSLNNVFVPIEISLIFILEWGQGLLQNVLRIIPVFDHTSFR